MKPHIPIKWLIALTHISVFAATALFVGFSTYFFTKNHFSNKSLNQPVEKAQNQYVIYEQKEVITARQNNLDKTRITGYAANTTGEKHIIYSFIDDPSDKNFQKTAPTATLLTNGKIFLNGVSGLGFAVMDTSGDNLSPDYGFLKKKNFPAANALFTEDPQNFFYAYGGQNSVEWDSNHKIYWRHIEELRAGHTAEVTDIIDSSLFPSGDFWIKLMGWSGQKGLFYAARQSDARTYGQIWKVRTDGKVIPVQSIKGALTDDIKVCSAQDYAVFLSGPLDPSQGQYGSKIGPSRLFFTDLKKDESKPVFYSEKLTASDFWVSCTTQKILAKDNGSYLLIDTNGKILKRLQITGEPVLFTDDGETILQEKDGRLLLLNLETKETVQLAQEVWGGDKLKIRYNVVGVTIK